MALRQETPFFDTEQAAAYLRLRRATLDRWRSVGGGPAYSKLGARVVYRREDLDDFALKRRRHSTMDAG
jgi:hypothetical protein